MSSQPITSAILLVGGFGTRLQPLTFSTPKPMLSVGGIPFTEHQIIKAREAGITEIVLATSFLAEVFEPYFGDGESFGIKISYAVEIVALGTGGAIAHAATRLKNSGPVVVFNGDVLSGHDLQRQMHLHLSKNSDVTLYLTEVPDARAYGVVEMDGSKIRTFNEKMENPPSKIINAGCYIFNRDIIESIPSGKVVSVERETFPDLLVQGKSLNGYIDNSYWLDIGTPSALLQATRDLISGEVQSAAFDALIATGDFEHRDDSLISKSATVSPDVELGGGTFVGHGAVIEPGVKLFGTFIGMQAAVGSQAELMDTFVADGSKIPGGFVASKQFFGYTSSISPITP